MCKGPAEGKLVKLKEDGGGSMAERQQVLGRAVGVRLE